MMSARARAACTLRSFLENLHDHGHDLDRVGVFVAVEAAEHRASLLRSLLGAAGEQTVLDAAARRRLSADLAAELNLERSATDSLVANAGFGSLRNSIVHSAWSRGYDLLVFVDDDEYPTAPLRDGRGVRWTWEGFLEPHQEAARAGADVTVGHCSGYVSPIPKGLWTRVPAAALRELGRIIALGNELIGEESFLQSTGQVRYRDSTPPPAPEGGPDPDPASRPFLGGNFAINLRSISAGRIPPFFTPPRARCDDTLFRLRARDATICWVESWIFHDPFDTFPLERPRGPMPALADIPLTHASIERFRQALLGWIRYAPIFTYLRGEGRWPSAIEEMLARIDEPATTLAVSLHDPEFRRCGIVLKEYFDRVPEDVRQLRAVDHAWRRIVRGKNAGEGVDETSTQKGSVDVRNPRHR
jgi:hypothetical protein